jgi:flagellar hook assembly protein FlgD
MFETNSENGNIEWDGKNLNKKEVPDGTYFYIISAKGKDGKEEWKDSNGNEVKKTGTISLFR